MSQAGYQSTGRSVVDQTALKFNQASIIALLLIGFVLNQAWLVVFVGVVMLVGTVWPDIALFKWIYSRLLKPAGLLRPNPVTDELQPHLFAQGVGGIFLTVSALAFVFGADGLGWTLAGIVAVLAGVNLFAGFCLGCFIYYQLARRGIRADLPWWRPAGRRGAGAS